MVRLNNVIQCSTVIIIKQAFLHTKSFVCFTKGFSMFQKLTLSSNYLYNRYINNLSNKYDLGYSVSFVYRTKLL